MSLAPARASAGVGAVSGFVTPDLRRSPFIHGGEALRRVTQDGVLLGRDMPRSGTALSADDTELIRAFLVSEATDLYGLQEMESSFLSNGGSLNGRVAGRIHGSSNGE